MAATFESTGIEGLLIVQPKVYTDERGYFFESYTLKDFDDHDLQMQFIQDNQSKSEYGVIRGLHYQLAPFSQTKLIRVIQGTIYDVAVDIRRNSPTFGKAFGIELSSENYKQLLIPKGFAHGFSVLSEEAVILYKCDSLYHPAAERGICYNDPKLAIDWKINDKDVKLSVKDKILPFLEAAEINFIYGDS